MLRARRLTRPGGTRAQRRARDETADPDRRFPQLRRASHAPEGAGAYTRRVLTAETKDYPVVMTFDNAQGRPVWLCV